MRNAFADEIKKLSDEDERIVLLSGDIGNRLFDNFKRAHPQRFYNCGVAEANMTGVAAGLALCGLRPITYTIASFNIFRSLEQIKIDLCYQNLPVIVVGIGAGLSYASLGGTHHSCEDIAMMRSLPNMTVLCPGDTFELRALLRQALKINGPVYLRLGKKGEENVHREVPTVEIGKGLFIAEGNDLCLLSTGNTLPMALSTAHLLRQAGVEASVVSMHTIKPLCQKFISEIFDRFTIVATIEEHSLVGGLGSLVAEWLADHKKIARLYRFGTKDKFPHLLGSQDFLRSQNDLLPEHIYNKLIIEIQELCKH